MVDPLTERVAYETGFFPRLETENTHGEIPSIHTLTESRSYLHCHFGLFQMAVHGGIDAHDGSLNDSAVLEFNRDLFTVQFL